MMSSGHQQLDFRVLERKINELSCATYDLAKRAIDLMMRGVTTVMCAVAACAATTLEDGTCSSDGIECADARWPSQEFESGGETAIWQSARRAFDAIDADGNGQITLSEWPADLISRVCNQLPDRGCVELFSERT